MPRLVLSLALALAAAPAAARTVTLPKAMLGVWAPEAEDCRDEAGRNTDSRVEVTPGSVGFYASIWTVRRWERAGEVHRGRASVAEEGESRPAPGRPLIALRLRPDGRLEVRRERVEAEAFVRCPAGTQVR
ncbi:MAG TPA: hypothetical protein VEA41_21990 [Salinarimonas sp.]|nr:hypothetical protein [Salinarimonas sp.]